MSDETRTEERTHRREADQGAVGGAIGGMTGGGVVAGVALSTLGPVGAVLGALAGYVGGWWAGRGVVEAAEELDDVEDRLRELHRRVGADRPWEETRHAYQIGYLAGRSPEWRRSDFDDVEADLGGAWADAHGNQEDPIPWEEVRGHARSGWKAGRERV